MWIVILNFPSKIDNNFLNNSIGGGHIFSKKALRKLVEDSFTSNDPLCRLNDHAYDDLQTGKINKLRKLKIISFFKLKENV